jgi:hypothetical protein
VVPARPAASAQPAPPQPDPGTFVYRDTGGPDEPDDVALAEVPAGAYGPDDPAYGPPDPSWYQRREEEDEAARRIAEAEELQHARGPFEPIHHVDEVGRETPGYYVEADYPQAGYQAPGYTESGLAEVADEYGHDDLAALADGALERIKDLYMTAEAIGDENLGKHFEHLLERQRQLISEYFTESGLGNSGASQVSFTGEGLR